MRAAKGIVSTMGELFGMLWERKLWWAIPLVMTLLLFAVLIVLGSVAGVGPFIYPLL